MKIMLSAIKQAVTKLKDNEKLSPLFFGAGCFLALCALAWLVVFSNLGEPPEFIYNQF